MTSPPPAPPPRPTTRRVAPGRLARVAAWSLAASGVVVLAVGGAGGALLGTAGGTAWLLSNIPGVSIERPEGSLLGGFRAARLQWRSSPAPSAGAGAGGAPPATTVTIRALEVAPLRWAWRPGAGPAWRVDIDRVVAERLEFQVAGSGEPTVLPSDLNLPVALRIGALGLAELGLPGQPEPVRDLRGRVSLAFDTPGVHEATALSATWRDLAATGRASIGAAAPLTLDAQLSLRQTPPEPAPASRWLDLPQPLEAEFGARGPLARFAVEARARAGEPSLQASAEVTPAARWPLPRLAVAGDGIDLAGWLRGAPRTTLSGRLTVEPVPAEAGRPAPSTAAAADPPLAFTLQAANARPAPWHTGGLPIRQASGRAVARASLTSGVELQALRLELADAGQGAGSVDARGRWLGGTADLQLDATDMQPARLDRRAPAMVLTGTARLSASGLERSAAAAPAVELSLDLAGRTLQPTPRPLALRLTARADPQRLVVSSLDARSDASRSTGTLALTRAPPVPAPDSTLWDRLALERWTREAFSARGDLQLRNLDPAVWWPGEPGSAWRRGPNRLDADATLDASWPAPPVSGRGGWRWWQLRGTAAVTLTDSQLAGVPLAARIDLSREVQAPRAAASPALASPAAPVQALSVQARATAGQNELEIDARVPPDGDWPDQWALKARWPQLQGLQPLVDLWAAPPAGARARAAATPITGTLDADIRGSGRWPRTEISGQLEASQLRYGELAVERASARLTGSTAAPAAFDLQAGFANARQGPRTVEAGSLSLTGTLARHELRAQGLLRAVPPDWMRAVAGQQIVVAPGDRTLLVVSADGGWRRDDGATASADPTLDPIVAAWRDDLPTRWVGKIAALEARPASARSAAAAQTPWLRTGPLDLELRPPSFGTGSGGASRVVAPGGAPGAAAPARPAGVTVGPGRLEALGAVLSFDRIAWSAGGPDGRATLDTRAQLEPILVAPLLARLQPDFGWQGDLRVGGRVLVRSEPSTQIDLVLDRQGGDLQVREEIGVQPLGLSDLRLSVDARDGAWTFAAGLAGEQLGAASGVIALRTAPRAWWPEATAPLDGVVEAQASNLGTWGAWVPAGWRLGGSLHLGARIGGQFGNPQWTGELRGRDLALRNLLAGVDMHDGEVLVALEGATARIERVRARGGAGLVSMTGDATLGEAPRARLELVAERFQALGRVDRRAVLSGNAKLELDRRRLRLDGRVRIDEALIDFSRADAPTLSDDVVVERAPDESTEPTPAREPRSGPEAAEPPRGTLDVDLVVDLGDRLRLRGRGLDTGLRGELRLTTPRNRLAINGTVRTADGTYSAYGQRLAISRGILVFTGAPDNPRLDIQAIRPNLDVEVGVAVSGGALDPRVRLYSDPEMSEIEKLSWLLLGRPSEGLGRNDVALLQRAALALLAGEGTQSQDPLTAALGLDDLSVRQSDGETRETVLSVGKQLSRRWYVGYERSLSATAGTWQVIYRIARQFTVRAQSGFDNSLDLIWTLRWQ